MPQPPASLTGRDSLHATVDSLQRTSDSLQLASDSLREAVDSLQDSTGVIERAARDVGSASDLLVQGRWATFGQRVVAGLDRFLIDTLPVVVRALVIVVLLYGVYRAVRWLAAGLLRRSDHVDEGLRNLTLRSLRIVALLFIGLVVLAQFGIDPTVLIGGISIVGLAIGFAARDTLENFIAGVTILVDRPFRVGDQLRVSDTYGTVVDISLRSTRLRTLNNEVMVMPNVQMITQKIVNHAMLGAVRVVVPFGVAYHESPETVRALLSPLCADDERIAAEPPPHVVVTALADSAVQMELRFFLTEPELEVPVLSEYLERVLSTLRGHGVTIPFPQLDVHVAAAAAPQTAEALVPADADAAAPASDLSGEAALPLVDVEGARPTPGGETLARTLEAEGLDSPGTPSDAPPSADAPDDPGDASSAGARGA